jgi:TP901 family phage tail tape measure protein
MSTAATSDVFVRIRGALDASFSAMAQRTDRILGDLQKKNLATKRTSEQIAALQGLKSKLSESKAAMDAAAAKSAKLAEEYGKLTDKTKRQEAELVRAEAAAKRASDAYERQTKAVDKLSTELRDAGVNLDNLDGEARKLGETFGRNERRFERLGNLTKALDANRQAIAATKTELMRSATVTAAFLGGVTALTVKGSEFDHQMTTMARTTGATAEAIGRADKAIWDASRSTRQSGAGLQEALALLVGKGLDFDQSVASIAAIGRSATASNTDVKDLADTAYTLQNALGIKPDGLIEAIGILSESGKKGGFELKEMAKWAPVLGGGFHAMHMGGKESVATMGAALQVARQFTGTGDEAANNMNNFLSKIMSPETIRKAKKLGLNVPKVIKKAIAEGENPFEAIMAAISKTTKGGDIQRLNAIFGDMQVNHFVRDLVAGMKDYKSIKEEALSAGNGSIEADFEALSKTSKNQLGAVAHRLEEIVVKLSRGLAPAIEAVLKDWSPMLDRFADYVAANPKTVANVAKLTAGVLALRTGLLALKLVGLTGKGGLLSIAQSIAEMQVKSAVSGEAPLAAKLGSSFGGAFKRSGVVLAQGFGFWGSVVQKGLGRAFGPIGKLASKGLGVVNGPLAKIGSKFGGMLSSIGGLAAGPLAKVGGMFGGMFGWVTKLGGFATPMLTASLAKVGAALLAIPGPGWVVAIAAAVIAAGVLIYRKWDWLKAWFAGVWDGMRGALNPLRAAFSRLSTALQPLTDAVLPALKKGWDVVSESLGKAWTWVKSLFGPVEETTESLDAAKESGKSFGEVLAKSIEWCFKPLEMLINMISWVIEKSGSVVDMAKNVWKVVTFDSDNEPPRRSLSPQRPSGDAGSTTNANTTNTKTVTNHNSITINAKGATSDEVKAALREAKLLPSNSTSNRSSFVDD